MSAERTKLLRERVPDMPIIVLAKRPDMSSRVLDIQDYVINGESVIPLFSTEAALTASLRGAQLGRPTMAIARPLLASVLGGNEVFLLDPQLPSQLRFTAAEFREAFPEPFVLPTTAPTVTFTVEEVFYIKPPVDRVILVGTITHGVVRVGDKLIVHTASGPVSVAVENIETIQHGDLKQASKSQQVGLRLTGIRKDQPSRGDRVTADGGA